MVGCSSILGDTTTDPGADGGESTTEADDDVPAARDCVRFTGDHSSDIDTGGLAGDALYLSGEVFLCADDVVVVRPGDLNEVVAASQLAASLGGPLLFPEPRLAAELGRLKPERVHLVGTPEVNVPTGAETVEHDIASAIEMAREELGVAEEVGVGSQPDATTIVETVNAIIDADRVTMPASPPESSTSTTAPAPVIDQATVVAGLARPTNAASLWLVDASEPQTILLSASVGKAIGASVVAIDSSDVLGYPEVGSALEGHQSDTLRYVGGTPDAGDWELAVLTNGKQLPGGGFYILPADQRRRYVAYYGHPGTIALGALGEQGPAETRQVMEPFVEAYEGDGAQVIPTYEIIATVASGSAGDDGDYSTEWAPDTFDDWITYAGENEMYVLLDLQPGREDFLSQAKLYEELLLLPYVGLAIDPEWRISDSQVHLEQTGTVDASEINQVIVWLGDLVRDNGLPQKMLVLHQFKPSMITNRDQVAERPELQVVVQMDGDGTEAQKNSTWSILKNGAEDAHWAWGWKNFFDEDEPGPPTPESTMSKVPTPVYVSYQ